MPFCSVTCTLKGRAKSLDAGARFVQPTGDLAAQTAVTRQGGLDPNGHVARPGSCSGRGVPESLVEWRLHKQSAILVANLEAVAPEVNPVSKHLQADVVDRPVRVHIGGVKIAEAQTDIVNLPFSRTHEVEEISLHRLLFPNLQTDARWNPRRRYRARVQPLSIDDRSVVAAAPGVTSAISPACERGGGASAR